MTALDAFVFLILFFGVVGCIAFYYKSMLPIAQEHKKQMAKLEYKYSVENAKLYSEIANALSSMDRNRDAVLSAMLKNKGERDRFTQKYIEENYDYDNIGVAYIFYHETKNNDLKIYLKMKWAFS